MPTGYTTYIKDGKITSGKEFLPQLPSTAFIIASLKHPEEVAKFREIYPNNFSYLQLMKARKVA